MADYWKSQAKKFCDFCKCWIADNKPSVEFHEKGKRHKENVEKRLKEIGQKSRKEYKDTLKVDSEMKKMEDAAMKAYLKDIEGDGDFTSQLIKQELKEKEEKIQEEKRKKLEMLELERQIKLEKVEAEETEKAGSSKETNEVKVKEEGSVPWYEAKSDEGYTYYWHVDSGEAVWEIPTEGFVSIAEQTALEDAKTKAQKELEEKQNKKEEISKQQEEKVKLIKKEEEEKEKEVEENARLAREKMRSRAAKKEKKIVMPFEPVVMGPAPKPDPYGGWKTVERYDANPIDYQLPKQNYVEVSVPVIVESVPKFKIREKTIGSIDGEGSGDFKKRKFNGSAKRNMRQRLDDQD